MSYEELQRIADLMMSAQRGDSIEPDGSLGFQFIIDFSLRLNAVLEVQSSKEKGTAISVKNLKIIDRTTVSSSTSR